MGLSGSENFHGRNLTDVGFSRSALGGDTPQHLRAYGPAARVIGLIPRAAIATFDALADCLDDRSPHHHGAGFSAFGPGIDINFFFHPLGDLDRVSAFSAIAGRTGGDSLAAEGATAAGIEGDEEEQKPRDERDVFHKVVGMVEFCVPDAIRF